MNSEIAILGANKDTAQSPVIVVDQYTGFDPVADTDGGGVHPIASGYQKMADKWQLALQGILEPNVKDLLLVSTSGNRLTTDDLICNFDLGPIATTTSIDWWLDASPQMTYFLPFEGGQSNAELDRSGNNHPLTKAGDPAFVFDGGHDGHGVMNFDGDDYFTTGVNTFPDGSYTKAVWVNWANTGSTHEHILSGETNDGHVLCIKDDKLIAGHRSIDAWQQVEYPAEGTFPTLEWKHVAAVYDMDADPDAGQGVLILYVDGVEVDSESNVPVHDVNEENFVAARDFSDAWTGLLDDVRVYNSALPPDQIQALFDGYPEVIKASETEEGDVWQCRVTAFSEDEAGTSQASNSLVIQGSAPEEPLLENLSLDSSSGDDLTTDDLTCTYELTSTATTSGVSWCLDTAPVVALHLPMRVTPATRC